MKRGTLKKKDSFSKHLTMHYNHLSTTTAVFGVGWGDGVGGGWGHIIGNHEHKAFDGKVLCMCIYAYEQVTKNFLYEKVGGM